MERKVAGAAAGFERYVGRFVASKLAGLRVKAKA
jgi:hypothetical protein